MEFQLGFLGAGMMAEAVARGLIQANYVTAEQVIVSDINEKRLAVFQQLGIHATSDNKELARKSKILFLAVKPVSIGEVLSEIYSEVQESHLIISIAAGIDIRQLESSLPANAHVVRVMPNSPCLVSATAAGFALGKHATEEDAKAVKTLFGCVGAAFCLPETLLDAVTGLSGSGPAYVFMMIEAMADGGVRSGLPRDVAMQLAAHTVFGAAKMALTMPEHPAELKNRVESPGGTTIAGTHELEKGGFRASVISAVYAATQRSAELGRLAKSAERK
eukprot:TRINITY_DN2517_c0_g1_i1.p1 TRINITY_DN2517_c0_g1~~TRINITY_DN2517_c0_g1_i1.p1  ORF type:complete len:276 (-),score=66.84 TRINITY_DN2517_c0_g1_i1:895-1722(-)